jgi:ABC-2 type transport system ATP-binding protein
LLTGQLRPTTGKVHVLGGDPYANPEILRKIGYCPEVDSFPERWTGREFVVHQARMSLIPKQEAIDRSQLMLEKVGMADRCDRPIQGYSKGMRQRIKLAQAMVHNPELILLDEPLNGLDPVGRREFMDLLHTLSKEGKSIIVSSHILFEVEQMTRNILLLHRGRLLANGDLGEIRDLIDRYPHRIVLKSPVAREIASLLAKLPFVVSVDFDKVRGAVELQTREPDQFYASIPKLVLENNLQIDSIHSPDNNLESVFRYLVEA